MDKWLGEYLFEYRTPYFLRQAGVILFLYIIGFLAVMLLTNKKHQENQQEFRLQRALCLSFPVGISIFVMVGYITLIIGIPYNTTLIGGIMTILLCVILFLCIKYECIVGFGKVKYNIIAGVIILGLIMISVSGYISISVSNDSLYYFWQYPRAICYFGGLRDQFDNFLTDTGLGAAIIGTLPFLFNFGETFGIQEFFHISFVFFFGNAVYEIAVLDMKIDNKKAYVISAISTIVFATCTPIYIISHWAMANMYFMEYYFICMYILQRMVSKVEWGSIVLVGMMLFTCSSVRMEGVIFILVLIIAASVRDFDGKGLAAALLPTVILPSIFVIKIFTTYVIDNPYIFLTPVKAILQFAALAVVILYLMIIKDKIPCAIKNRIPIFSVLGLLVLNVGLLFINSSIYVANLRAMVGNLTGQSGWGILPYLSIGAVIIIITWELFVDKRKGRGRELLSPESNTTSFYLFNTVLFFLTVLAVSFARGDAMYVNTGDSGNRVLLQITPIVLMTFICFFMDLLSREEGELKA